jgi:N-acetylglucosamine malate deacetylase 1
MNALIRVLLKRFSRAARPYLKSYGLLQTSKQFNKSALVWEPEGERVVILAPHMDDEVIGCGGTLRKHVLNGADVTVVFLTDGRYGSSTLNGLLGEMRRRQENALIESRKREARRALGTLGIHQIAFLDAEETKLAWAKELPQRLRQILESIRPDLVYLPFFLEEHPDHRAVSRLLLDAMNDAEFGFDCIGYEVWTPLFPNCFVKIDDTVELKKQALQHYESQLTDANYIHTSLGLNAYRSCALLNHTGAFAEAFFRAPLQDYLKLYRSYCEFNRAKA